MRFATLSARRSDEVHRAIDEVRGALLSDDDDAATASPACRREREEAEGLPVPIVPGTRVTEAQAVPPAPPRIVAIKTRQVGQAGRRRTPVRRCHQHRRGGNSDSSPEKSRRPPSVPMTQARDSAAASDHRLARSRRSPARGRCRSASSTSSSWRRARETVPRR